MSMYATSPASADTIDLADILRALRRGWRAVIGFTLLGAVGAAAVILFAPPKFAGTATIVLKTGDDVGSSVLSKLTGGLGDAAGGLLAGTMKSPMETELQILQSRAVAGAVVDSLLLRAKVSAPRAVPATRAIRSLDLLTSFKSAKYHFVRAADGGYEFDGPDVHGRTSADGIAKLPVGNVALQPRFSAPAFELLLRDREDAITWVEKHLSITKAGGEVARVAYRGDDSLTAAAVPNALIAVYLARRTTTDRGVNQRNVEFLTAKADTAAAQLAAAERSLRRQQEQSGVIDPETVGKIELERASQMRANLTELEVEGGAIKQLIARVSAGLIEPRELAAFPTFLKSPGINDLLSQLSQVETDRYKLLESRTEKDPEVVALTQSAQHLEGQLMPLARAYSASLQTQQADLQHSLDTLRAKIDTLPAIAESGLSLQRDVIRLNQVYAALEAQLVEARLAAITEGGDVHALDVAAPAKKPAFPEPFETEGIGISGGLLCGFVAAFLIGMLGRWIQDATDVERLTGVPAFRLEAGAPLLIGGMQTRTVLVMPLDARARAEPVVQRIAQTALARALSATVLDLSSLNGGTASHALPSITGALVGDVSQSASQTMDVNASIERLEQEYGMVIVQLPGIGSPATAAALRPNRPVVLVAPAQRIERGTLAGAVQTLRRLDVPCAGVVLSGGERNGVLAH